MGKTRTFAKLALHVFATVPMFFLTLHFILYGREGVVLYEDNTAIWLIESVMFILGLLWLCYVFMLIWKEKI